jgi:GTP 3',8-cyclase
MALLLERDAAALVKAGVTRFNVSIDSLQRESFAAIARRDVHDRVLRGLRRRADQPGVGKIKLNAVAMRGFTEREVVPFAPCPSRSASSSSCRWTPGGGGPPNPC